MTAKMEKEENEEFWEIFNELNSLKKKCVDLVEDIYGELATTGAYLAQGIWIDNTFGIPDRMKDAIENLTQLKAELEKEKEKR